MFCLATLFEKITPIDCEALKTRHGKRVKSISVHIKIVLHCSSDEELQPWCVTEAI